MKIFIDAYNFLKRSGGLADDITQQQREHFIARCKKYAKKKGHQLMVVFDGGQSSMYEKYHDNGVCLIYAGYNYLADDAIKQEVKKLQGTQVLLISNDRELRDYVQKFDTFVLGCNEFAQYLYGEQQQGSGVIKKGMSGITKTSHDTASEIDQLMHAHAHKVLRKKEDRLNGDLVVGKQKKLSKKERTLQKILEKL
jgi:predicted RNA-binding protein with PIN domain